jgi:mycothiol synthase
MEGPGQVEKAPEGEATSIAVREIQGLTAAEAQALVDIGWEVDSGGGQAAGQVEEAVRQLIKGGGRAWLLKRGGAVSGYASIMPVPGLPGLYDLDGFIAPDYRRRGLGSHLLATLVKRLAGGLVGQLSYPAPGMESPAAWFLVKNGFFIEHVEQRLVLDDLSALPVVYLDRGLSLRTFARRRAIAHFRRLYEASFAGLAWHQPYEADREVAQELVDPGDLLFMADGRRPIGFLWLRWPDLGSAEIEPVGLLPAYRGRGLGRLLMLAGLHRARQQGASRVWIGAWQANTAALALYEQLGFRPAESTFFLARDL